MITYRTVPYRTAPHRTAPHRTAPHRTAPHRTAPHRTAPHRTAPHRTSYIVYRIVSYRIVSYRIVSYRIVSYRIVSYRIVSYRIVSYRIVSYRIDYILGIHYVNMQFPGACTCGYISQKLTIYKTSYKTRQTSLNRGQVENDIIYICVYQSLLYAVPRNMAWCCKNSQWYEMSIILNDLWTCGVIDG